MIIGDDGSSERQTLSGFTGPDPTNPLSLLTFHQEGGARWSIPAEEDDPNPLQE